MTRSLPLLASLSILTLAACEVPVAPPAGDTGAGPSLPAPDLCHAADYKGLVGQPRSVLTTMLLPAGARVIGPDDAVTADFRADRVNIEIGASGRIERVGCY